MAIKNSQYSNVLYLLVNYLVKPSRNCREKNWKVRGLLTFSGLLFENISITWPPLLCILVLLYKINCIVFLIQRIFLWEFRSLSHMLSLSGIKNMLDEIELWYSFVGNNSYRAATQIRNNHKKLPFSELWKIKQKIIDIFGWGGYKILIVVHVVLFVNNKIK